MKCICCGKEMVEVDHISDDPTQSWWEGVVEWVTVGYGSCHDTDRLLVAICDECITAKAAEGVLAVDVWAVDTYVPFDVPETPDIVIGREVYEFMGDPVKVIEVQGVGPNPDVVIEGRFADRATVSFDQLSERL